MGGGGRLCRVASRLCPSVPDPVKCNIMVHSAEAELRRGEVAEALTAWTLTVR